MGYQIEYAYTCHIGRVRANNEDNFWCCGDSLESVNFGTEGVLEGSENQSQMPLLAAFDGMGGESCGEMAAYLAADACGGYYREHKTDLLTKTTSFLQNVCQYMNHAVCEYSKENRIRAMGATAALLGFGKKSVYACNLGDSRIYQWYDGNLEQLSTDHVFTGRTFGKPPLLQFVGIPEESMVLEPSVAESECANGKKYLICSDGLTDMVSDDIICKILDETKVVKETVERLLSKALEAGGRDNITILLCEIKGMEQKNRIRNWFTKLIRG